MIYLQENFIQISKVDFFNINNSNLCVMYEKVINVR